jgi:hypothetical protein
MTKFTAWQWLLIDAATNFGLDKKTFEVRLQWAYDNLDKLETYFDNKWKERPLFIKAVMAIRKAQKGIPTGHMVGCDSSASGIQIMSAITGCITGATNTGLINPNERADIYSLATKTMNQILRSMNLAVDIPRDDMKQGLMTSFYGSKAEPKKLFGEDTPELEAFYKASKQIAPGAWELLTDLLDAWQPYALKHSWQLPDGFNVHIKVMKKIADTPQNKIEIDELDHGTFTYVWYENQGSKKGISLAANTVHSLDAMVVRTMHRKCNYNPVIVNNAYQAINKALLSDSTEVTNKVAYYKGLYERSQLADVVILPWIQEDATGLSKQHLKALKKLCEDMLQHKPFDLVTIHDQFNVLPGNVDWVRYHYKETLADLADSEVLSDVFTQLLGTKVKYTKLGDIGNAIRNGAYGIC